MLVVAGCHERAESGRGSVEQRSKRLYSVYSHHRFLRRVGREIACLGSLDCLDHVVPYTCVLIQPHEEVPQPLSVHLRKTVGDLRCCLGFPTASNVAKTTWEDIMYLVLLEIHPEDQSMIGKCMVAAIGAGITQVVMILKQLDYQIEQMLYDLWLFESSETGRLKDKVNVSCFEKY